MVGQYWCVTNMGAVAKAGQGIRVVLSQCGSIRRSPYWRYLARLVENGELLCFWLYQSVQPRKHFYRLPKVITNQGKHRSFRGEEALLVSERSYIRIYETKISTSGFIRPTSYPVSETFTTAALY